jgi:hypothetical protein
MDAGTHTHQTRTHARARARAHTHSPAATLRWQISTLFFRSSVAAVGAVAEPLRVRAVAAHLPARLGVQLSLRLLPGLLAARASQRYAHAAVMAHSGLFTHRVRLSCVPSRVCVVRCTWPGSLDLGKTQPVWAYIMSNKEEFLNSAYDPNAHKATPRLTVSPAQVTLWAGTPQPPNTTSRSAGADLLLEQSITCAGPLHRARRPPRKSKRRLLVRAPRPE